MPRNALPVLGRGYRSLSNTLLSSTPFDTMNSSSQLIPHNKSEGPVKINVIALDNRETLARHLGVHSEATKDIHHHAKKELAEEITFDEQYVYLYMRKTVIHSEAIGSDFVLDNSVVQTLVEKAETDNFSSVNASFYMAYGNEFVSQINFGAEVIVILKIAYQFQETQTPQERLQQKELIRKDMEKEFNSPNVRGKLSQGMSVSSCWVHAIGVKAARTTALDGHSLETMITSICGYMESCGSEVSEVPLSFYTSSYSEAKVRPPTLGIGQPSMLVCKDDVNNAVDILNRYITAVQGDYVNIENALRRFNSFLKLYQRQLQEIDEQHERSRCDKKETDSVEKNASILNAVCQELTIMLDNMNSRIIFRDEADIAKYRNMFEEKKEIGRQAIRAYRQTTVASPIMTVEHPAVAFQSHSFLKPKSSSENFYARAYELRNGKKKTIDEPVDIYRESNQTNCCFFKRKSPVASLTNGKGYIHASVFKSNQTYTFSALKGPGAYYLEFYPQEKPDYILVNETENFSQKEIIANDLF